MKSLHNQDKLIVALDVPARDATKLVEQLKDVVGMFKVGSQLFTTIGPSIVEEIIKTGNRVFLDLKFHDIPHQVAGSARVAAELGVSLFTVHASGGTEMMKRAVDAVSEVAERKGAARSRIVAVTVLTSIDAATLGEIGISDSAGSTVERLARLSQSAGVDGVVSSPNEAATIRAITNPDFLIVTPGIRPKMTTPGDDQKRVATPSYALNAGADYLVVGRPITSAPDPAAAAAGIVAEMEAAANDKEQASASNV